VTNSEQSPRVLAIAMDAVDAQLALRWAGEGRLPTLAGLMAKGSTVRLRSPADHFPEAVWPTINSGCLPGKHGLYNWRCVRPGTQAMVYAPPRTYRQPFWRLLREGGVPPGQGYRLLIVDVRKGAPLRDDRVTEVIGWGERAATLRESWPRELYGELVRRYGRYPRWLDNDFDRSCRSERRHLQTLEEKIPVRTALLSQLLRERPWDFCLTSYWEPHNAGHVFHRYLLPESWTYDERRAEYFGDALESVYRLVDEGIGQLIDVVPDATDVVVFSGYGFRPNSNGRELLPRVLTALGYQVPNAPPRSSWLLHTARAAFPLSVRSRVNRRLSVEARERVMTRMWVEATDWTRTRAVAEAEWGQGWVRLNLRGREPLGTVEPGPEYDALCEEISDELRSLTNAETGAPAVAEVARTDAVFDGPHVGDLPDLVVRWNPDGLLRAVRHPRLGVFHEDLRHLPRSEHTGEGFLVAAGPSVRAGATAEGHVADIAPTLLELMHAAIPDDMDGRPLTEIISPGVLAAHPARRERIEWSDHPWADAGPPEPSLNAPPRT
jgi:predicted AlkP superfamily phosphohydrolase/phosphomutase